MLRGVNGLPSSTLKVFFGKMFYNFFCTNHEKYISYHLKKIHNNLLILIKKFFITLKHLITTVTNEFYYYSVETDVFKKILLMNSICNQMLRVWSKAVHLEMMRGGYFVKVKSNFLFCQVAELLLCVMFSKKLQIQDFKYTPLPLFKHD